MEVLYGNKLAFKLIFFFMFQGYVVVLKESSLDGVGEGEGLEHTCYCDIESINSSTMAAPISHPEAIAANDFSTVLPNQAGE